MNSNIKMLIAAFVLIVLGALTCGTAVVAMGFRPVDLNTADVITKQYEIEEAFKDIRIKGDSEKIVIAKSTDAKCSLVFNEFEDEPHTYRVENGRLTIESIGSGEWGLHFSIGVSTDITLYIPEEKYGIINIETDSGIVDISDIMAEDLILKGDSGLVGIKNSSFIDTMQITVDSGAVSLEGIRCTDLITNGESGFMKLTDVVTSRSIDIQRESGMVSFEGCDSGYIKVKTESGVVKGDLLTGKTFKVDSECGSVNVPPDSGSGICEITTESGLISISVD